jgi:hypothetical protein
VFAKKRDLTSFFVHEQNAVWNDSFDGHATSRVLVNRSEVTDRASIVACQQASYAQSKAVLKTPQAKRCFKSSKKLDAEHRLGRQEGGNEERAGAD